MKQVFSGIKRVAQRMFGRRKPSIEEQARAVQSRKRVGAKAWQAVKEELKRRAKKD